MVELEDARPPVPHEGVASASLLSRPVAPLARTLSIAQRGCLDPAALTEDEIADLARTMLMHYRQMGIA